MKIRQDLQDNYLNAQGFTGIRTMIFTDGIRIVFANGDVMHSRPSGNAPEFRCYSNADTFQRAQEIVTIGLRTIVPAMRQAIERESTGAESASSPIDSLGTPQSRSLPTVAGVRGVIETMSRADVSPRISSLIGGRLVKAGEAAKITRRKFVFGVPAAAVLAYLTGCGSDAPSVIDAPAVHAGAVGVLPVSFALNNYQVILQPAGASAADHPDNLRYDYVDIRLYDENGNLQFIDKMIFESAFDRQFYLGALVQKSENPEDVDFVLVSKRGIFEGEEWHQIEVINLKEHLRSNGRETSSAYDEVVSYHGYYPTRLLSSPRYDLGIALYDSIAVDTEHAGRFYLGVQDQLDTRLQFDFVDEVSPYGGVIRGYEVTRIDAGASSPIDENSMPEALGRHLAQTNESRLSLRVKENQAYVIAHYLETIGLDLSEQDKALIEKLSFTEALSGIGVEDNVNVMPHLNAIAALFMPVQEDGIEHRVGKYIYDIIEKFNISVELVESIIIDDAARESVTQGGNRNVYKVTIVTEDASRIFIVAVDKEFYELFDEAGEPEETGALVEPFDPEDEANHSFHSKGEHKNLREYASMVGRLIQKIFGYSEYRFSYQGRKHIITAIYKEYLPGYDLETYVHWFINQGKQTVSTRALMSRIFKNVGMMAAEFLIQTKGLLPHDVITNFANIIVTEEDGIVRIRICDFSSLIKRRSHDQRRDTDNPLVTEITASLSVFERIVRYDKVKYAKDFLDGFSDCLAMKYPLLAARIFEAVRMRLENKPKGSLTAERLLGEKPSLSSPISAKLIRTAGSIFASGLVLAGAATCVMPISGCGAFDNQIVPGEINMPVSEESDIFEPVIAHTLEKVQEIVGETIQSISGRSAVPEMRARPYVRGAILIPIFDQYPQEQSRMRLTDDELRVIFEALDNVPIEHLRFVDYIATVQAEGNITLDPVALATDYKDVSGIILYCSCVDSAHKRIRAWKTPSFVNQAREAENAKLFETIDCLFDTISHEVGHIVHFHLIAEKFEAWRGLHEASGDDRRNFTSAYAMTNHLEDFAELYMSWAGNSLDVIKKSLGQKDVLAMPVLLEKTVFIAELFVDTTQEIPALPVYTNGPIFFSLREGIIPGEQDLRDIKAVMCPCGLCVDEQPLVRILGEETFADSSIPYSVVIEEHILPGEQLCTTLRIMYVPEARQVFVSYLPEALDVFDIAFWDFGGDDAEGIIVFTTEYSITLVQLPEAKSNFYYPGGYAGINKTTDEPIKFSDDGNVCWIATQDFTYEFSVGSVSGEIAVRIIEENDAGASSPISRLLSFKQKDSKQFNYILNAFLGILLVLGSVINFNSFLSRHAALSYMIIAGSVSVLMLGSAIILQLKFVKNSRLRRGHFGCSATILLVIFMLVFNVTYGFKIRNWPHDARRIFFKTYQKVSFENLGDTLLVDSGKREGNGVLYEWEIYSKAGSSSEENAIFKAVSVNLQKNRLEIAYAGRAGNHQYYSSYIAKSGAVVVVNGGYHSTMAGNGPWIYIDKKRIRNFNRNLVNYADSGVKNGFGETVVLITNDDKFEILDVATARQQESLFSNLARYKSGFQTGPKIIENGEIVPGATERFKNADKTAYTAYAVDDNGNPFFFTSESVGTISPMSGGYFSSAWTMLEFINHIKVWADSKGIKIKRATFGDWSLCSYCSIQEDGAQAELKSDLLYPLTETAIVVIPNSSSPISARTIRTVANVFASGLVLAGAATCVMPISGCGGVPTAGIPGIEAPHESSIAYWRYMTDARESVIVNFERDEFNTWAAQYAGTRSGAYVQFRFSLDGYPGGEDTYQYVSVAAIQDTTSEGAGFHPKLEAPDYEGFSLYISLVANRASLSPEIKISAAGTLPTPPADMARVEFVSNEYDLIYFNLDAAEEYFEGKTIAGNEGALHVMRVYDNGTVIDAYFSLDAVREYTVLEFRLDTQDGEANTSGSYHYELSIEAANGSSIPVKLGIAEVRSAMPENIAVVDRSTVQHLIYFNPYLLEGYALYEELPRNEYIVRVGRSYEDGTRIANYFRIGDILSSLTHNVVAFDEIFAEEESREQGRQGAFSYEVSVVLDGTKSPVKVIPGAELLPAFDSDIATATLSGWTDDAIYYNGPKLYAYANEHGLALDEEILVVARVYRNGTVLTQRYRIDQFDSEDEENRLIFSFSKADHEGGVYEKYGLYSYSISIIADGRVNAPVVIDNCAGSSPIASQKQESFLPINLSVTQSQSQSTVAPRVASFTSFGTPQGTPDEVTVRDSSRSTRAQRGAENGVVIETMSRADVSPRSSVLVGVSSPVTYKRRLIQAVIALVLSISIFAAIRGDMDIASYPEQTKELVVLVSGADQNARYIALQHFNGVMKHHFAKRGFGIRIIDNASSEDLVFVLADNSIHHVAVTGHGSDENWQATDRDVKSWELTNWYLDGNVHKKDLFIRYTCGTTPIVPSTVFGWFAVNDPYTQLRSNDEYVNSTFFVMSPELFSQKELQNPSFGFRIRKSIICNTIIFVGLIVGALVGMIHSTLVFASLLFGFRSSQTNSRIRKSHQVTLFAISSISFSILTITISTVLSTQLILIFVASALMLAAGIGIMEIKKPSQKIPDLDEASDDIASSGIVSSPSTRKTQSKAVLRVAKGSSLTGGVSSPMIERLKAAHIAPRADGIFVAAAPDFVRDCFADAETMAQAASSALAAGRLEHLINSSFLSVSSSPIEALIANPLFDTLRSEESTTHASSQQIAKRIREILVMVFETEHPYREQILHEVDALSSQEVLRLAEIAINRSVYKDAYIVLKVLSLIHDQENGGVVTSSSPISKLKKALLIAYTLFTFMVVTPVVFMSGCVAPVVVEIDVSGWSDAELIAGLSNVDFEIQAASAQELYSRGHQEGIDLARALLVAPRIQQLPTAISASVVFQELIDLGPLTIQPLTELIYDFDAHNNARQLAIKILGKIGDFSQVGAVLIEVIEKEGLGYATGHSKQAFQALIDVFTRESSEFLLSMLDDERAYMRQAVLAGLSGRNESSVMQAALDRLSVDSEPAVRMSAAEYLGSVGGYQSIEALISVLGNDRDREVRRAAIEGLRTIGNDIAVNALITALHADEDIRVRSDAAYVLGEFGGCDAIAALSEALRSDEDWTVRFQAAKGLGLTASIFALPALEDAQRNDIDTRVQDAARESEQKIRNVVSSSAISSSPISKIKKALLLVFTLAALTIGSHQIGRINYAPVESMPVTAALVVQAPDAGVLSAAQIQEQEKNAQDVAAIKAEIATLEKALTQARTKLPTIKLAADISYEDLLNELGKTQNSQALRKEILAHFDYRIAYAPTEQFEKEYRELRKQLEGFIEQGKARLAILQAAVDVENQIRALNQRLAVSQKSIPVPQHITHEAEKPASLIAPAANYSKIAKIVAVIAAALAALYGLYRLLKWFFSKKPTKKAERKPTDQKPQPKKKEMGPDAPKTIGTEIELVPTIKPYEDVKPKDDTKKQRTGRQQPSTIAGSKKASPQKERAPNSGRAPVGFFVLQRLMKKFNRDSELHFDKSVAVEANTGSRPIHDIRSEVDTLADRAMRILAFFEKIRKEFPAQAALMPSFLGADGVSLHLNFGFLAEEELSAQTLQLYYQRLRSLGFFWMAQATPKRGLWFPLTRSLQTRKHAQGYQNTAAYAEIAHNTHEGTGVVPTLELRVLDVPINPNYVGVFYLLAYLAIHASQEAWQEFEHYVDSVRSTSQFGLRGTVVDAANNAMQARDALRAFVQKHSALAENLHIDAAITELLHAQIENGFTSRDFIDAVFGLFDEETARTYLNTIFELGNASPHKSFSQILNEFIVTLDNRDAQDAFRALAVFITSTRETSAETQALESVRSRLGGRILEADVTVDDRVGLGLLLANGFMFKRAWRMHGTQLFITMEKRIDVTEPTSFAYANNRLPSVSEITHARCAMIAATEKEGFDVSVVGRPTIVVVVQKRVEKGFIWPSEPAAYVDFMKERGQEVGVDVVVFDVQDLNQMKQEINAQTGRNRLEEFVDEAREKGWVIFNRAYELSHPTDIYSKEFLNLPSEVWSLQATNGLNSLYFETLSPSKARVIGLLRESGIAQIQRHLPKSMVALRKSELREAITAMLGDHEAVMIKPDLGSKGQGIVMVNRAMLLPQHNTGRNQLDEILEKLPQERVSAIYGLVGYNVEEALDLCQNAEGKRFIGRWIIQKGINGQWVISQRLIRTVAEEGSLITNTDTEGEDTVENLYREEIVSFKQITEADEVSLAIVDYLNEYIKGKTGRDGIANVGIDIAFTRDGGVYFLETNERPYQAPTNIVALLPFRIDTIKRIIDYASYESTRLQLERAVSSAAASSPAEESQQQASSPVEEERQDDTPTAEWLQRHYDILAQRGLYDLDRDLKMREAARSIFTRAVAASVVRGARVLDLATGRGTLIAAPAFENGAASLVGVDISAHMLAQARSNLAEFGSRVHLIEGDILDVARVLAREHIEGKFNIITLANVLTFYSAEERMQILSGAVELLENGGYLVILYRRFDEEPSNNALVQSHPISQLLSHRRCCSWIAEKYVNVLKTLGLGKAGVFAANYETDEDWGFVLDEDAEVVVNHNVVVWGHAAGASSIEESSSSPAASPEQNDGANVALETLIANPLFGRLGSHDKAQSEKKRVAALIRQTLSTAFGPDNPCREEVFGEVDAISSKEALMQLAERAINRNIIVGKERTGAERLSLQDMIETDKVGMGDGVGPVDFNQYFGNVIPAALCYALSQKAIQCIKRRGSASKTATLSLGALYFIEEQGEASSSSPIDVVILPLTEIPPRTASQNSSQSSDCNRVFPLPWPLALLGIPRGVPERSEVRLGTMRL